MEIGQIRVADIKHYPINNIFFFTLIVPKGVFLKPGQFLVKGKRKWKIEGIVTNIKPQKNVFLDLQIENNIIDCKVALNNLNEVDKGDLLLLYDKE